MWMSCAPTTNHYVLTLPTMSLPIAAVESPLVSISWPSNMPDSAMHDFLSLPGRVGPLTRRHPLKLAVQLPTVTLSLSKHPRAADTRCVSCVAHDRKIDLPKLNGLKLSIGSTLQHLFSVVEFCFFLVSSPMNQSPRQLPLMS